MATTAPKTIRGYRERTVLRECHRRCGNGEPYQCISANLPVKTYSLLWLPRRPATTETSLNKRPLSVNGRYTQE
ncbi:hypothetical protein PS619_02673 [Pseudomonas fluorescens]|nr:hypothetical protein PS681_02644 [Pseudomonas fluorescens]VVM88096.1 hypothetical protein PS619_02673 [Pseudomonas fluorescens]VVN54208.1 hypothetical protein PS684_01641 [Pseudomonas fluorescens]